MAQKANLAKRWMLDVWLISRYASERRWFMKSKGILEAFAKNAFLAETIWGTR